MHVVQSRQGNDTIHGLKVSSAKNQHKIHGQPKTRLRDYTLRHHSVTLRLHAVLPGFVQCLPCVPEGCQVPLGIQAEYDKGPIRGITHVKQL